MKITYDPETMEVISTKIGHHIDCPEGLETAWCEWPSYAKKCRVLSVVDNQAEIEVLEWHLTLDQMKAQKQVEFEALMTEEGAVVSGQRSVFKNPAWGVLYEDAVGIKNGSITDFSNLLITKVAALEGVSVTTKAIDVAMQIDSSRVELTAITEKYLSKIAIITAATDELTVLTTTWED
ncbi:hypothetical protein [Desulfobacula sp.]|uniref:hypothetical protein n=1 Tax=Desulfobacula sp. TaxID=2593537 RepID=UPI0026082C52|nr:hypothetical protein [Desulfobacula sp.]